LALLEIVEEEEEVNNRRKLTDYHLSRRRQLSIGQL
jgi:hypothetical protein